MPTNKNTATQANNDIDLAAATALVTNLVIGSAALMAAYAILGDDFITVLIYIALPVILVQVAFGRLSIGALQVVFNGDLNKRVQEAINTGKQVARTKPTP
jgi:hypothetical protein